MLLLAFDTSTAAITAAVHDGTAIVGESSATSAMAHGELLTPMISAAMTQAGAQVSDLTDIAVGVGPGPFTGLRVGIVTALTLKSALDVMVHPVCSLDVIAADAANPDCVVASDARRKEVYWARYVNRQRVDGPHVSAPTQVPSSGDGASVYGPAVQLYPDEFGSGEFIQLRAASLAELVASGRADEVPLEPLYLRRPDAVALVMPKLA